MRGMGRRWLRGARGRGGIGGSQGGRAGRWAGRDTTPAEPWAAALVGTQNSAEEHVTDALTASTLGSGDVAVLATPIVLGLAERAAVGALAGKLPESRTTVGASVQLQHSAPTPVGVTVRAEVRVEAAQGNRLLFGVRVTDPAGEVARGRLVRAVVDRAEFERSATGRRPR